MKLLVVFTLLLVGSSSFAASKRLLSCKGEATAQFEDGYRLNILKNEKGELKAVFSGGYTTLNSLFTWKVKMNKESDATVITNLNKTDLEVVVYENEHQVDDLSGSYAKVNLEFDVKPYLAPVKHFKVSGVAACKSGK